MKKIATKLLFLAMLVSVTVAFSRCATYLPNSFDECQSCARGFYLQGINCLTCPSGSSIPDCLARNTRRVAVARPISLIVQDDLLGSSIQDQPNTTVSVTSILTNQQEKITFPNKTEQEITPSSPQNSSNSTSTQSTLTQLKQKSESPVILTHPVITSQAPVPLVVQLQQPTIPVVPRQTQPATPATPAPRPSTPFLPQVSNMQDFQLFLFSLLPPNCQEFKMTPFLQCSGCQSGYWLTPLKTCQKAQQKAQQRPQQRPQQKTQQRPQQKIQQRPQQKQQKTINLELVANSLIPNLRVETPQQTQTSIVTSIQQPKQSQSQVVSQDKVQVKTTKKTQVNIAASTEQVIVSQTIPVLVKASNIIEQAPSMPNQVIIDDKNCLSKNPLFSLQRPKGFSNTRCSICFAGYYYDLNDQICKLINDLCATFDKQNNCLTCKAGYYLQQGKCIFGIAPSQTQSQSQASAIIATGTVNLRNDPSCRKFAANNQCQQCFDFHYFNKERNMCVQVHPSCKSFDPITGNCLSCYVGYNPSGRQCSVSIPVLVKAASPKSSVRENCLRVVNNECTKCSSHFYLQGGFCKAISDLCKTFDVNTGQCLSCYQGYRLNNGKCALPINSGDPFCHLDTQSGCKMCIINYYLCPIEKKCKAVSPLCRGYNPLNGFCIGCLYPYTVDDKTGQCVYLPY